MRSAEANALTTVVWGRSDPFSATAIITSATPWTQASRMRWEINSPYSHLTTTGINLPWLGVGFPDPPDRRAEQGQAIPAANRRLLLPRRTPGAVAGRISDRHLLPPHSAPPVPLPGLPPFGHVRIGHRAAKVT